MAFPRRPYVGTEYAEAEDAGISTNAYHRAQPVHCSNRAKPARVGTRQLKPRTLQSVSMLQRTSNLIAESARGNAAYLKWLVTNRCPVMLVRCCAAGGVCCWCLACSAGRRWP